MITKFKCFLNESPDKCYDLVDNRLDYKTEGAAAFGTYKDKVYIGFENSMHFQIEQGYTEIGRLGRDDYDNSGRFWKNEKIITFWNVDGTTKLSKMIDDINAELIERREDDNCDFQIDDTWLIEVYKGQDFGINFGDPILYNLYKFDSLSKFSKHLSTRASFK